MPLTPTRDSWFKRAWHKVSFIFLALVVVFGVLFMLFVFALAQSWK